MKPKNDTVISVRCSKVERRLIRRASKVARETLSAFCANAAVSHADLVLRGSGVQPDSTLGSPATEKAGREAQ